VYGCHVHGQRYYISLSKIEGGSGMVSVAESEVMLR
jgi:hypothetical protein